MATQVLNAKLIACGRAIDHETYPNAIEKTETRPLCKSCLIHVPTLEILLCRACTRVVDQDYAIAHVKRYHPRLFNTDIAATISEQLEKLTLRYQQVVETGVQHDRFYLSELPVNLAGFKCRACDYTNVNRKKAKTHFNRQHPELKTKVEEHVKSVRTDNVMDRVPLQELSGFGNNVKVLFIPKLPDTPSTPELNPILPVRVDNTPRTAKLAEGILAAHRDAKTEEKMERGYTEENTGNMKLVDAFRNKSQILNFLQDKDVGRLIELVEPAKHCELKFDKLDTVGLEKAVMQCMKLAHDDVENAPIRLRQLLRAEDQGAEAKNMKDFMRLNDPTVYNKRFARLVTFVLRVVLLQEKLVEDKEAEKYLSVVSDVTITSGVKHYALELTKVDVSKLYSGDDVCDTEFEKTLTALTQALLDSKISLRVKVNHTSRNVVVVYYFCCCIDRRTNVLKKDVTQFGKLCSELIFGARLMFLAYYRVREEELYGDATDEDQQGELLAKNISSSLTNSSKNYFETFVKWRPYIRALAKEYKADDWLIREPEPEVIEYLGNNYPLQDLRKMFGSIGRQLEQMLKEDLLFIDSFDELEIDYAAVHDTPRLNGVGQSVIDVESLQHFQTRFLGELVDRSSRMSKMLVKRLDTEDGLPKIVFKESKVAEFISKLNHFVTLLAIAVNLFSGGPLRATELTTLTYKNTANTRRSLIYNSEHRVFLAETRYSKTNNTTRRVNVNQRFLVPSLSRVVLIFIVGVVPLRDYIYQNTRDVPRYSNPHLFALGEKTLTAQRMTNKMSREVAKVCRVGFGIKGWRRIVNYIIKMKLRCNLYADESEEESETDDLIEDKMANRATRTSHMRYLNTESFHHGSSTPAQMEELATFSAAYFQYWNLLDEAYNDGELMSRYVKVEGRSKDDSSESMFTLQPAQLRRHLSDMLGKPNSRFLNEEQERCVRCVLCGVPYVTYISRTGSGKSVAYLLPSFVRPKTLFIVLTPRVSLTNDLMRRAAELKIKTARTEDAYGDVNLVFASVEDLGGKALEDLVRVHRGYGRDVTIMLDEVHLMLLEKNFRVRLRALNTLLTLSANMVFITATMPKQLLMLLNETFHLGKVAADRNIVVRGKSNRPDISYRRIFMGRGVDDVQAIVTAQTEIERENASAKDKVLIFVNRIDQGQRLSEKLGIPFVKASDDEAQTVLAEFGSGSQRYLLATSIAEVGLDIKSVRYTINVEPIFGMLSVAQASGRIRGQGVAYILCYGVKQAQFQKGKVVQRITNDECNNLDDFMKLDKAYYKALATEERCLRTPMSFFLDGVNYQCSPRDRLCSLCEANAKAKKLTAGAESTQYNDTHTKWFELEAKVADMKERYCLYCILDPYNYSRPHEHEMAQCREAKANAEFQNALEAVRTACKNGGEQGRGIPRDHGCHRCLMPKNICTITTNNVGMQEEDECYVGEWLVETMAVLWLFREDVPSAMEAWMAETEVRHPMKVRDVADWFTELSKRYELYGMQTMKLLRLVFAINILELIEEQDVSCDSEEEVAESRKRSRADSVGTMGENKRVNHTE